MLELLAAVATCFMGYDCYFVWLVCCSTSQNSWEMSHIILTQMEEVRTHWEPKTGKFSMKFAVSMIMLCMCEIIYKTCVTQLLNNEAQLPRRSFAGYLNQMHFFSSIGLIALAFNSPQQGLVPQPVSYPQLGTLITLLGSAEASPPLPENSLVGTTRSKGQFLKPVWLQDNSRPFT